ncbi:MAG: hypothetical protein RQ885_08235 [Desulfurococcales archaeon]|jgi:hypothetical protein|nr:hypothetical protein [Desulfurococcales archaeon]
MVRGVSMPSISSIGRADGYVFLAATLGFMLDGFDLLVMYSVQPIIYSIFTAGLNQDLGFIASYAVGNYIIDIKD